MLIGSGDNGAGLRLVDHDVAGFAGALQRGEGVLPNPGIGLARSSSPAAALRAARNPEFVRLMAAGVRSATKRHARA